MVVIPRAAADTPAIHVLNAHPRHTEVVATSAFVGLLTVLALIALMLMNYHEGT